MRFNLRWLAKFVDIDLPLEQVLGGLTMAGLEVEEYIDLGWDSRRIVIGEVLEIDPHPNSRKLHICRVRVAADESAEPARIVCGAPNAKVGGKYPCALPGAVLPGGHRIEKAVIADEASEGMLCSGAELGWSDDTSGLLELDSKVPVGEPFDGILDLGITPNRPDCLSVLGVARDLAAYFRKPLHPPAFRCNETSETTESLAAVTLSDKEGCPRYTARLVRGIKVGPSPAWLARAVEATGLRSINNVVDVTNYVLMEYGHPLHAFDFDRIDGGEIIVRSAREGETLTTLDGVKRELSTDDLLITDTNKAIALAGVMGGENSEILNSTEAVLLESAYFDPVRIRRTRRRLGLQTDSSFRFERGTDRENIHVPLNRAAQLIREVAGGEIAKGFIDATAGRTKPQPITLRIERTCALLGVELEGTHIADGLVQLGCEIVNSNREQLVVLAPSHRVDLTREIDLVEEVGRLYGYDKIESTIPYVPARPTDDSPLQAVREQVAEALVAEGLSEVVTYSFTDRESIERSRQSVDDAVALLNPLAQTQSVLRTSLFTSMLSTIAYNHSHANVDLALWETSRSYHMGSSGDEPYVEYERAVVGLAGNRPSNWDAAPAPWDFFDLKGIVERVLARAGIHCDRIDFARNELFHPGRSAILMKGERPICTFGQVHPNAVDAWDLRGDVFLAEFDLEALGEMRDPSRRFRPIVQFPAVSRDLAVIVDSDIPAAAVEGTLHQTAGNLLESLRLFDVYDGEHVGAGKKSLAYSMTFRSPDRTLTDDEVNEVLARILETLAQKHGASLRDS